jgi:hypothetical protein
LRQAVCPNVGQELILSAESFVTSWDFQTFAVPEYISPFSTHTNKY